MKELDREVLAAIAGDVLRPELAGEIVTAAREMFEASARPDGREQLAKEPCGRRT